MAEEKKLLEKEEKPTENKPTKKKTTSTKKPKVKKYKMDDIVTVTSLVKNGTLVFIDVDGTVHEWEEFGDEIDLMFKDIRKMATRHKRFFKDCYVKVPDAAIEQLKIKDYLLDSSINVDELDALFELKPAQFKEKLIGSSDGIQRLVVDTAIEKLKNNELDSLKIMRIIHQITGQNVEELAKFIEDSESDLD